MNQIRTSNDEGAMRWCPMLVKLCLENSVTTSDVANKDNKGPFGLSFLITQFSVSITHNSKMVGPIVKRLFGQTITLFP